MSKDADRFVIESVRQRYDKMCDHNMIHNFIDDYHNGIIPESINLDETCTGYREYIKAHYGLANWDVDNDDCIAAKCNMLDLRHDLFVIECGFTSVTMGWVRELVKQLSQNISKFPEDINILEICSGIGCLAKALNDCGVNVIATDSFKDEHILHHKEDIFIPIQVIDMYKALEKYYKDVDFVLCAWPRNELNLVKFMKRMYELKPSLSLIYVGDSVNGCCANVRFFNAVKQINELNLDETAKFDYNKIESLYPKWDRFLGSEDRPFHEIIRLYRYNHRSER